LKARGALDVTCGEDGLCSGERVERWTPLEPEVDGASPKMKNLMKAKIRMQTEA